MCTDQSSVQCLRGATWRDVSWKPRSYIR